MTHILGISCFYHDAAACLVTDGRIVAAAEEERFTRLKHDSAFPAHAIAYCLAEGGIDAARLDHVVFYEKPFVKFERIVESFLGTAPRGFPTFQKAMPMWMKQKFFVADIVARETGYAGRCLFTGHHEAHAASAFYPSPFSEAAILTLDGVGEWSTASWGIGRGNEISLDGELRFPHSLGMLYSAFTYYLGFKVNSGEYKLMGLAPYGEPAYQDRILSELLDLRADGSFRLNMDYFDYLTGQTMTGKRFDRLFGGPPRKPGEPIERRHMDLARSIQEVTEEIVLRMGRHVRKETGMRRLCMAGGVSLNCTANGRLRRERIFDDLWIQPAAGDAGGAMGAALAVWHRHLGNPRPDRVEDALGGCCLGPAHPDGEIESFLSAGKVPYRKLAEDELAPATAALLADGKVIGWFQGRMEFGPRALGARSILADPRDPGMQSLINRKIKFRESFRPFAPAVLREHASEWFDIDRESPYMLVTFPVREEKRLPEASADRSTGLDKLGVPRSVIPAVTHVDFSARVQTVAREDHPRFHDLIEAFRLLTDCPVLVNTSFNVRGEPIVRTPAEAFACFMGTDLDYLVMGSFLLDKRKMPAAGSGGREDDTKRPVAPEPPPGETRKFGAALAAILWGIAAWKLWQGRTGPAPAILGIAGAAVLGLSLFCPRVVRPVQRVVMKLATGVGRVNTFLILGLVFFGLLTPVAAVLRRFRPDPLRRAYEPGAGSYWLRHAAGSRSRNRYERMF